MTSLRKLFFAIILLIVASVGCGSAITRWRRASGALFDRATAQLVSSIDEDDEDNNADELSDAAVVGYARTTAQRQYDPPASGYSLRDIERELQRLNSPSERQHGANNNKIDSNNDDSKNENYVDEMRQLASRRKNAPHFLRTPPPLQAVDPRCNSESLQRIMIENMSEDVRESKQAIIQAAEALIGGSFNVICARTHFSYVTTTRLFCLVVKRNAKCYAFLTDTSPAPSPAE